jgi:hypothetical protein
VVHENNLSKARSKQVCKIFLLDGTAKAIYVHSLTTVKEATDQLDAKFDFTVDMGFGLFEVNHEAGRQSPFMVDFQIQSCHCQHESWCAIFWPHGRKRRGARQKGLSRYYTRENSYFLIRATT